MTRRSLSTSALLLAAVAGCSSTPVVVTPRSFERPGKVSFACFETLSGVVLPLERCRVAADGTADPSTSLLALVTQTARGEVAAVDLTASRLLDSDTRVPGFTFVPVGELPSDIVVPALSPSKTYVSNSGTRDISVVSTAAFRASTVPSAADLVSVPVADGAPGALALSPDERTLFVAVPQAGLVLAYPILVGGMLGDPTRTVLATVVPAAVDAVAGTDVGKLCPSDSLERPAFAARAPVALGTAARPSALIVDAEAGQLVITDAALPIVHVLDLATLTELEPFVVGVPTNEAALTPAVPVSELEGDCAAGAACTRYLYAIDAVDGSVLVYDVAERAVVPVSASDVGPRDRIRIGAVARGIAVLTPDYPGIDNYCAIGSEEADNASPTRLRGVFVAISAADGSLRVVDVQDLDAPCRGGAECSSPPNPSDVSVFIRRHRPRIGSFLTQGVSTLGTPTVVLDGQPFPVANDGVTESTPAPDLLPVTCPAGQRQAYPVIDETATVPALVCAVSDPWTVMSEAWGATWEGAIPGSQGGRGRIDVTTPTLYDPGLQFCAHGVLGAGDVPGGAEPEAGYAGDVLAITARLPDETREGCLGTFPEDAAGVPATALFPIVRAFQDHVELEATGSVAGAPVDWSQVAECFVQLVTFEVRTRGAYTVVGDRSRFLHRVVASGADSYCEVDTSAPSTRVGRARPDTDFVSPFVAFHISASEFGDQSVALSFLIGNVPPRLAVDFGSIGSGSRFVGSLPSSLRYNPFDRRLYAIDEAARGLVQLDLAPFSVRRTYE